jgi:hypothetical protein
MNSNNLKIELKDFPDDIYILLEEEFRVNFFKTAWKINRSYRHLAKKMGVSNTTMLSFRRGKDTAGLEKSLSIGHLKKIIEFSQDSPLWSFNWNDIQNNVKLMKAKSGTLKIFNPHFPIYDSIRLRELITHLMCDGSALNEKYRTSKYASTSLQTVNEFKRKLLIFGEISNLKIRKRTFPNHYFDCYTLNFSKAITKILSYKFKINFRSTEARLPKEFFNGNRLFLIAIIRSFIIDEGCIKDRNISLCSGSIGLLRDLILVCNNLGYQYQKIKKSNRTYYLDISPNSFEKVYKDIMQLGVLPIEEKQQRLDLGIQILKNKPNFKKLNGQILSILKNKSSTKLELARILLVNTKTIGERLLRLEKQSVVKRLKERHKGKGGAFIWTLNKTISSH